MKMKKSIRYKVSFFDVFSDIFISLVCIGLAVFSLYIFWQNINRVMEGAGQTQIGTVTFKRKSVQRKFVDRALWDRPVQNSPIYNGDTLRTSPLAEAIVHFTDESSITIGESTMIQIFIDEKEKSARIDLTDGSVGVDSQGSGMTLRAGSAEIAVSKGASVSAKRAEDEPLKLSVEKGDATVLDANTAQETIIGAGESLVTGNAPALFVVSPAENLRILHQEKGTVPVNFSWTSTFPTDEELVLEISSTKDFSTDIESLNVKNLNTITINRDVGTSYWRLYAKTSGFTDASAISGKIRVLSAPVPNLVAPIQNERFGYRNQLPLVGFVWIGNDYASSYLVEVADNPAMTNPVFSRKATMTSIATSSLEEGRWYWRVTPSYVVESDEVIRSSVVSTFTIEKKADLLPPMLILPKGVADTSQGRGLTFSWNIEPEAFSYALRVSRSPDMKSPVLEQTVSTNYFTLDKASTVLPNGEYYWDISVTAKDGAVSPHATPNQIVALDTEVILRSVFPPDKYILSDNLLYDTKFVWKSNLIVPHRFQVSRTADFSDLTVDITTHDTSLRGILLSPGEWYWRLVAEAEDFSLKTSPKKFVIAGPLAAPDFINLGKTVVIPPDTISTFEWKPVQYADYYQLRIFKDGIEKTPVYENLFLDAKSLSLNLRKFDEGKYSIQLQAFSQETVSASRRYGLKTDHAFYIRQLYPVELKSPRDNFTFAGLTAWQRPPLLTWTSHEKPKISVLTLKKVGQRKAVLVLQNPTTSVRLSSLTSGKYEWFITAKTADDLDISAVESSFFTVLPIPPLVSPKQLTPEDKHVFDVAFFKVNKEIIFKWEPVKTATHYIFVLKNKAGKVLLEKKLTAKNPLSVVFNNFTELSKGDFFWTIKAQNVLANGDVLQDGVIAESRFTVSLPSISNVETKNTGVLYGK